MINMTIWVVYLDKKIQCLRFHSIWNTVRLLLTYLLPTTKKLFNSLTFCAPKLMHVSQGGVRGGDALWFQKAKIRRK